MPRQAGPPRKSAHEMRLRESRRHRRFVWLAVVVAFCSSGAAPSEAGLWFQPVAGLEGADTNALASDGTTLWAGTISGVWKLQGTSWGFDSLRECFTPDLGQECRFAGTSARPKRWSAGSSRHYGGILILGTTRKGVGMSVCPSRTGESRCHTSR